MSRRDFVAITAASAPAAPFVLAEGPARAVAAVTVQEIWWGP